MVNGEFVFTTVSLNVRRGENVHYLQEALPTFLLAKESIGPFIIAF